MERGNSGLWWSKNGVFCIKNVLKKGGSMSLGKIMKIEVSLNTYEKFNVKAIDECRSVLSVAREILKKWGESQPEVVTEREVMDDPEDIGIPNDSETMDEPEVTEECEVKKTKGDPDWF